MSAHPVIALLGATGITGRVALAFLQERAGVGGFTVRAGGRDPERIRDLCERRGIPEPEIVAADAAEPASLRDLVEGVDVLVNLAGPYTRLAPPVLDACIRHGTHYLDLTGEAQLLHRTDRDRNDAARAVGVAIVHTAGLEALPVDVLVDIARRAAAGRGHRLRSADLTFSISAPTGTGLLDSVSGGTLQSLIAVLRDPDAPRLADIAARLPAERLPTGALAGRAGHGTARDPAAVRATSPLSLRRRTAAGRTLAPMSPLATINPPVVHRTQALSPIPGTGDRPLAFREALVLGPDRPSVRLAAAGTVAAQRMTIAVSRLPWALRSPIGTALGRLLPGSGAGPGGDVDTGRSWTLDGHEGTVFAARWSAAGNPGYGTTPRLVSALAIRMATHGVPDAAFGSSTPALALDGDLTALRTAGVTIALL